MRDLIKAIRADEACHREVNHHFADCKSWESIDHSVVEIDSENQKLKFGQEPAEKIAIEEKSSTKTGDEAK